MRLSAKSTKAFTRFFTRFLLSASLISTVLVSTSMPAHAATSAGNGGTVNIAPSTSGVINDLLTGAQDIQALNFGTETVTVVVTSNAGNIGVTTSSGLAVPTGYQTNVTDSATTIAFYGTPTSVNNALNTLRYYAGASTGTAALTISISDRGSNVAYDASSGFYYQYVSNAVTWDAAYNAITGDNLAGSGTTASVASRQSQTYASGCAYKFNGMCGYFGMVLNSAQNAYINSKVGSTQVWLGGSDRISEGSWVWADPKAPGYNKKFSNQSGYGSSGSTGEAVSYSIGGTNYSYVNWNNNEPNNSGLENALQMLSGASGNWNDLAENSQTMGYIVQYGGLGETVLYGPATSTVNINVAYVPTMSVALNSGLTTATYRQLSPITATISPAGKTIFYANGKIIPGCKNLSGTTSVQCNWRPSLHGYINLTVRFTPTNNNYPVTTSAPLTIFSSPRSGNR